MGSAFGCIIGGAGSLAGCWNTYRQLEGAEGSDAGSPCWTWLDKVLLVYGGLGAIAFLVGLVLSPWLNRESTYSLLLLGGMVLFQGAPFLIIRGLMRRGAQQEEMAMRKEAQWRK